MDDHSEAFQFQSPLVSHEIWRDSVIVVGALGLLILGIALFVRYIRGSKPARSDRARRSGPVESDGEVIVKTGRSGRKRKVRRHHRPRNPTLAETGGLPPPRPDGTPPRGT